MERFGYKSSRKMSDLMWNYSITWNCQIFLIKITLNFLHISHRNSFSVLSIEFKEQRTLEKKEDFSVIFINLFIFCLLCRLSYFYWIRKITKVEWNSLNSYSLFYNVGCLVKDIFYVNRFYIKITPLYLVNVSHDRLNFNLSKKKFIWKKSGKCQWMVSK